jgi:hypothetical protein
MANEKATIWTLGSGGEQRKLGNDLAYLIKATTLLDKLNMRANLAKDRLLSHCDKRWVEELAASGEVPTPIKLVNADGQSVTFVVQDRTKTCRINASVFSELEKAIGRKNAKATTAEKKVIYFADEVLDQPSLEDARPVRDLVEEYLSLMVADMLVAKVITKEQADALVEITPTRTFTAGFLGRLPKFCGFDFDKLTAAVKSVGSAITRYLKV